LQRLESETLPQYFRHNRFQSLVRQLNFYSFRKINRERNVWIYKHALFHRDRPEDLHLVRRRTCPGLDGRKQRFNRLSARKINESDSESKSDDSSIDHEDSDAIVSISSKRSATRSSTLPSKRVRRAPIEPSHNYRNEDEVLEEESKKAAITLLGSKGNRGDIFEQSLAVAEVAQKLEEHARRANMGTATRRYSSGIVTPTYGAHGPHSVPTTSLLTYDDEESGYLSINTADKHLKGTVTPSETDSSYGEDSSTASVLSNQPKVVHGPVVTCATAVGDIEKRLKNQDDTLASKVDIAKFCMINAPAGDDMLETKILNLIGSSGQLSAEFDDYRRALHPDGPSSSPVHGAVTLQHIWEQSSSRGVAVKEFKTFAVNCIQQILTKQQEDSITSDDRAVLKDTADAWRRNVEVVA